MGHYSGYALVRTQLTAGGVLSVGEVRDRAQVFLDGAPVGVLSRDHHDTALVVPGAGVLTILIEDQGRVNYGPRIGEAKGLIDGVLLDGTAITGWEVLPLNVPRIGDPMGWPESSVHAPTLAGPAFAAGTFTLEKPTNLFLSTLGWGKGVALINGFHLGRYWSRGPQETLFVPAPVLRAGVNTVVMFETLAAASTAVEFVGSLQLGHTEY
jgi:beta-galactosidase